VEDFPEISLLNTRPTPVDRITRIPVLQEGDVQRDELKHLKTSDWLLADAMGTRLNSMDR